MTPNPIDRRDAKRSDPTPRRTRIRLRELCDEVLASYRAATGGAPVTEADRAAADAMLRTVAPLPRR
jgi:hypothetical protein